MAAQKQINETGAATANLPGSPGAVDTHAAATHGKQEIAEACVLHLQALWLIRSRRKRVRRALV